MKFSVIMQKDDEVKEWAENHMGMTDQDGIKVVGLTNVEVCDHISKEHLGEGYAVRCKASEEKYYSFLDKYCEKGTVGPVKKWAASGARFFA